MIPGAHANSTVKPGTCRGRDEVSSSSDVLSTAHVWSIKVCDWAMRGWAIPHPHAPNEGRSQLAPGSEGREGATSLPICRWAQGLPAEEIVWGREAEGTYSLLGTLFAVPVHVE